MRQTGLLTRASRGVCLGALDELLDGPAEPLIILRVQVLVPDHAAMVDDDEGRIALDVPPRRDGPGAIEAFSIPPATPGDLALVVGLLQHVAPVVVVDA